jgi:hypothetical protein
MEFDVNKRTYKTGYSDGPGRYTAGHPDWQAAQSKKQFDQTWGKPFTPAPIITPSSRSSAADSTFAPSSSSISADTLGSVHSSEASPLGKVAIVAGVVLLCFAFAGKIPWVVPLGFVGVCFAFVLLVAIARNIGKIIKFALVCLLLYGLFQWAVHH